MMNKSSELVVTASGILAEETGSGHGVEGGVRAADSSNVVVAAAAAAAAAAGGEASKGSHEVAGDDKAPKFAMIFNKYNAKLNMRTGSKYQDDSKSKDKIGSKYTMIFNKDVTIRAKNEASSLSKTDLRKGEEGSKSSLARSSASIENPLRAIEPELSSLKLNDAETLMTLYGRSNLFIPELTICSLSESEDKARRAEAKSGKGAAAATAADAKRRATNDSSLRLYNSLTSLSKSKAANRRSDNVLKNKIASLTSLETHLAREVPRKHVSVMQERKLFRVRSLDLSESVSSSDSDLERSLNFQKANSSADDAHSPRGKRDAVPDGLRKSDKKSRGDTIRRGDKENGCRKQVQWKSEVDVIYFESHQAADGDRSGEILGRVMEPLREEWEQQRTGFYAKMVPLPLGSHLSERWQSLLKI